MGWYIIPLLIIVAVIFIAFSRNAGQGYRFGSGLFKSSEDNLDEQDEFSDKDYFNGDGLLK